MVAEHIVAHRDALKKQLTEIYREIEIAQRAPVAPAALSAAIEQARRDQDALTSPVLEDLRETAENLSDDIEHVWLGVCRSIALAENMADKAPTVPRPPTLIPAITAAETLRASLVEQLHATGIDTINLPDVPPHPHLDKEAGDGAR
jgi:hypothetical protein